MLEDINDLSAAILSLCLLKDTVFRDWRGIVLVGMACDYLGIGIECNSIVALCVVFVLLW